ncbi:unnamed protein product [Oppiella nova]|uniref:Uncharacterized protein n=1 Tax=Oppiella nova TaxID=334625 RepID=A0A7R9MGA1_9ACAR|nr:unnamed protein product [Oppiella nova]CAG2175679.1 unnamed protein product [Oppiella nova]
MQINLNSVVYLTHICVEHLEKTKGNVINISSIGGLRPVQGFTPYNIAKCAMDMFTKCMAAELGPKRIRVNVINPGPIRTEFMEAIGMPKGMADNAIKACENFTVLGRVGESEDVGDSILYLASDHAAFITGTNVIFSRAGANVVVTGRRADKVSEVAKECLKVSPKQSKALEVVADVTKPEDLRRLVDTTVKHFGKLDVLVNNAGAGIPTNIMWRSVFLDMFTKCMAAELGPNRIRVNVINPGPVRTGILTAGGFKQEQSDQYFDAYSSILPVGRAGYPDEIGYSVLYLASDHAAFVTGTNLVSDGGATAANALNVQNLKDLNKL